MKAERYLICVWNACRNPWVFAAPELDSFVCYWFTRAVQHSLHGGVRRIVVLEELPVDLVSGLLLAAFKKIRTLRVERWREQFSSGTQRSAQDGETIDFGFAGSMA